MLIYPSTQKPQAQIHIYLNACIYTCCIPILQRESCVQMHATVKLSKLEPWVRSRESRRPAQARLQLHARGERLLQRAEALI